MDGTGKRWTVTILFVAVVGLWAQTAPSGVLSLHYGGVAQPGLKACDPALPLTADERAELIGALEKSETGRTLFKEYQLKFGELSSLIIQWDTVSYSQISKLPGRVPANISASSAKASVVCVHLAKKLPDIEHIADLSHELVHATRLSEEVLKGEGMSTNEFVHARIAATGGEADAFGVECAVKREILGHWDGFCSPYVSGDGVAVKRVVDDLYSGALSASLTGEPYPVMLAKQFRRMAERRALNGILK
jgi:hypothetical protein